MEKAIATALAAFTLSSCTCSDKLPKMEESIIATGAVSELYSKPVDYFCKIRVDAVCNVYYRQGDKPSVRVVGRRGMDKLVNVNVRGETLVVEDTDEISLKGMGRKNNTLKVEVTSPDLISVESGGVGNFKTLSPLDTDTLRITIGGVGNIEMDNVLCDRMELTIDGVGNADMDGLRASSLRVANNGVGNVDLDEIKAGRALIVNDGLGKVKAHFAKCAKAVCRLGGMGGITISGKVGEVETRKDGLGSINNKTER